MDASGDDSGPIPGHDPHVEDRDESDDDADSMDEEDEELLRNIGEHSMMERVQKTLFEQLSAKHDRIAQELREQEEEVARLHKEREETGVSLYNVQQQLSKLQMSLETKQQNCNAIASVRAQAQAELDKLKQAADVKKADVADADTKLQQNKAELDSINETIRQVETYNDEMKAEIAVTRRAAYRVEEAIQMLEKSKAKQDSYIDHLTEQLKRLQDQAAMYDAQLAAQRSETGAAEETLAEASAEMQAISVEKKQLMSQWKSSLIGMQKRDEALQAARDALRQQREESQALQAEIQATKKSIESAQGDHAQLQTQLDKAESELRYLDAQLTNMQREQESLAERAGMLQKSLATTDAEAKRVAAEQESLRQEVGTVEQHRQTVDRERQELEMQLAASLSTQTTVKKAARNLSKEAQKVVELVHSKEMEKAGVENEIARVRVDALNTEAHNKQLQESLSQVVAELREKDKLVEKYEMEIRQRNDAIEKKMNVVDRLNRKFEKLTGGQKDENLGPLEATIANLQKQIAQVAKESEELQQRWLADQAVLVDSVSEVEQKAQKLRDMSSTYVLLDQKRVRLNGSIESQESEIKGLETNVRAMHKDMARINALISENEELTRKLEDSNYGAERTFVEELKRLEKDSIQYEARIASLKEEKARVLEELMETERQVLLWEKKIELEKETQAALDPSVGMAEAAAMEKEIHRMKIRYETLRRDQERLIQALQGAVKKRDDIGVKYRGRRADPKKDVTRAGIQKKQARLKKELNRMQVDIAGYEEAIQTKRGELSALEQAVEERTKALAEVESQAAEHQREINSMLFDKQKSIEAHNTEQSVLEQLQSAAAEGPGELTQDVLDETADAELEQQQVQQLVRQLQQGHPDLGEVLERVYQLTVM